jgi:lipid-A-disaccharide synthase
MLKVAIIAGEPSGDLLASGLIRELKLQTNNAISLMGIGGKHMKLEGFNSSFDMSILSVGGFGLDLVIRLPKILWIRSKIIKQIIEFKPDVFIGVDAPDFNFYIEKKLKELGIKTIHYISPSIWAWRYERIYAIKKSTDLMLCAFPMEEEMYLKEGIRARFVGHLLADKIDLNIDNSQALKKLQIEENTIVFTILVGSRAAEFKRHAKIFIEACNLITKEFPLSQSVIFLFPVVSEKGQRLLNQAFNLTPPNFHYKIIVNLTREAIMASSQVLAKSGTVTLEVALYKKPLIVSYKVSPLTALILKRKLKSKFVALPNILLQEEIVPEILQDEATPMNLAKSFLNLYQDVKHKEYIKSKFYELHEKLKYNASFRASSEILEFLK